MSDPQIHFSGYASMTDTPYKVGSFQEVIKRGAFKRTLSENPDVQLLINHGSGGSGMPIARTGKNMTLTEDDRGLRVDAVLDPDDPDVQLLARKMQSGLINAMSFAFQATDDEWDADFRNRVIRAVSIHRGDVSVVNQPATPHTSASVNERSDPSTREGRKRIAERAGRNVVGTVELRASLMDVAYAAAERTLDLPNQVVHTKCKRCSGTGRILLANAHIRCPNCNGAALKPVSPITDATNAGPDTEDAPHPSTVTDGSSRARKLARDILVQRERERQVLIRAELDGHLKPKPVSRPDDAIMLAQTLAFQLERELRAKYSSKQLKQMVKQGHAFVNANGDPSFPIEDLSDLKKAIQAVGRSGADHDAVRRYVRKRAAALGATHLIPSNWHPDGSLSPAA